MPGIDFTDDPLLSWRNFSYQDTQISRLGINHDQIPINQPVCPFRFNHRDGQHRTYIDKNRTPYFPNRHDTTPQNTPEQGAYTNYKAPVSGVQDRILGPKFKDHYTQATLFYNSLSDVEKEHLIVSRPAPLQLWWFLAIDFCVRAPPHSNSASATSRLCSNA